MAATSVKVRPEREKTGYGELMECNKVRSILASIRFFAEEMCVCLILEVFFYHITCVVSMKTAIQQICPGTKSEAEKPETRLIFATIEGGTSNDTSPI